MSDAGSTSNGRNSVGTGASFAIRLAGLPANIVDDLRTIDTYAAANDVLAAREWVLRETDEVVDAIYHLISRLTETEKSPFVRLKRALRHDRAAAVLAASLKPALSEPLYDRILAIEARRRTLKQAIDSLPGVLTEERQLRAEVLRKALANDQFARALLSSSPNLMRRLSAWLKGSGITPRRRDLNSLAQFVVRCAAKTSPKSTFTTVGLGRWSSGPGPTEASIAFEAANTVTELSVAAYQRLAYYLAGDPRLRAIAPLRVNPTGLIEGDRLWWVPSNVHKPLISVGLSPPVRACFEMDAVDTPTAVHFIQALTNADPRITPEEAWEFVDELIAVGLLERVLPVADQVDDRLEALVKWVSSTLGTVGSPVDLELVRDDLARINVRLRDYCRTTSLGELSGLSEKIRQTVRDLTGPFEVWRSTADVADFPIFYDNSVLPETIPLRPRRFETALSDLDVVRRGLAVFDPKMAFRIGLKTYFVAWFGAGASVSFIDFVRKYYEDGPQGPTDSGLEGLRLLLTPEHEQKALASVSLGIKKPVEEHIGLRRRLVADIASIKVDQEGIIRMPTDLLRRHIDTWPVTVCPPKSISVYAQASATSDMLILNSIDTGYGRSLARTRKLMPVDPLAGEYVEYSDVHSPILAELDALFGNTVNARRPSVRYAIEYAGSLSNRSREHRLRIQDIRVTHDAGQDKLVLFHSRRRREVQPVHTGLMWDALLPPIIRLLMDAFAEPATYVHPNSWWLNDDPEYNHRGVRCHPRIDFGLITLRRAFWTTYGREVPRYRQGQSDDNYLLEIIEWLRANSIPERSFVRVFDRQVGRLRKNRKPMLLDTANWFLVDAFRRREISDDDLVLFTEELPLISSSFNDAFRDNRVAEFVFEVSDGSLSRRRHVD